MGGVLLAALIIALAGCGDGDDQTRGPSAAPGSATGTPERATVYASLPAGGRAAEAAELGIRNALRIADGRAGRHPIDLVILRSSHRGAMWRANAIRVNARRAAGDRSTIAYIGELDRGGSSISVPITARAGILQVSPADGLTSLGRVVRDSGDAERYSPYDVSTFARFVPPDLDVARAIASRLEDMKARRLALLEGSGVADHELAELVRSSLWRLEDRRLVSVRVDRLSADASVARTVAARPDAVVFAGAPDSSHRAVLAGLADRLPRVPVLTGPPLASGRWLAALPARSCAFTGVPQRVDQTVRGRRIMTELSDAGGSGVAGEGLLGYAAMRLVLNAVERHGLDRAAVVGYAHASVDHDDVVVGYGLGRRAHVEGASVSCVAPATR